MNPFDGPRLKVRRARRLIEDAAKEINAFLGRGPYRLRVESDADPAYQLLRMQSLEPLPDEIPLIIGDAIHNLRSALDHLACDLVRQNGESDKNVYWPISRDKNSLGQRIKEKKVHRASDDVQRMIHDLAPYPGGNDGLVALHEIDIVDKHRIIVPIGHVPREPCHTFFPGDATLTFIFPTDYSTILVTPGEILLKFQAIPQLKEGSEKTASFDIAFADRTPLPGEAVSPWLHKFANYLEAVIETFGALCLSGERLSPPPPIMRGPNFGPKLPGTRGN